MIVVVLVVLLGPGAGGAAERISATLHAHSRLSTGDLALGALVAQAEREGIGAILLTENYLLRVEYGLPPFRALTRAVYEERSIGGGLDAYLREVAAVRRLFPRVILVPGVEVMPHYHWQGSPLTLQMTLYDTQKNLLVFGIEDRAALARLPMTGNPNVRVFGVQSIVEALPVLLIVPGVLLLARRRVHRVRLGTAVVVVRRRRWWSGGGLVVVGLAALLRGWPFTVDAYPPWSGAGLEPHQALIDEVERQGGVVVWSFPEAFDYGERGVGPVRVKWHTDPYPDDLLRTAGYTAFGAVYEQPTQLARPGYGWDRLLKQYVAGERGRPIWAVGESGFHGARAGKRLGAVQTVFIVDERSPRGILDAFKRGRMYAVRRSGVTLALSEFSVTGPGGAAGMGETLAAPAGTPIEIRIRVDAADGGAHPLRVTLVRDGEVAAAWPASTPFAAVHRAAASGARSFYRLEARISPGEYLVANPVFVAP